MRCIVLSVVGAMLVLFVASTHADDRESVQGQWEVRSFEKGGQTITNPPINRVTFAGDKVVFTRNTTFIGQRDWILVDKTQPKQLDIIKDTSLFPGIYELEGKTLRWCFASPDGERPKTFSTQEDDGRTLLVLETNAPTTVPNKPSETKPEPAQQPPESEAIAPKKDDPDGATRATASEDTPKAATDQQKSSESTLGYQALFVLGGLITFWLWRKIWLMINGRLISLPKYIANSGLTLSEFDMRNKPAKQVFEAWVRKFRSTMRALCWKSSVLPAIAVVLGVIAIRYFDLTLNMGATAFIVFVVIAVILRQIGFWLRDQFQKIQINHDDTQPELKLMLMLERPRHRHVFRVEQALLILTAVAVMFVDLG